MTGLLALDFIIVTWTVQLEPDSFNFISLLLYFVNFQLNIMPFVIDIFKFLKARVQENVQRLKNVQMRFSFWAHTVCYCHGCQ